MRSPFFRSGFGGAAADGGVAAAAGFLRAPSPQGGSKMLVFAVLMDKSGLTDRKQGIVVVHKSEHQLPMFVISFEHHHHKQALAMLRSSGLPPGLAGRLAASASSLAGRLGGQPTSTALSTRARAHKNMATAPPPLASPRSVWHEDTRTAPASVCVSSSRIAATAPDE